MAPKFALSKICAWKLTLASRITLLLFLFSATIFGQKKRTFRPKNAERRINPNFQIGLKGRQGRKETRSFDQIQQEHSSDNLYKDPGKAVDIL